MPLDTSIYARAIQPIQQPDSPLDIMQKVSNLRDTQAIAQDRAALVQQRQQTLQQKALDDARDRQENDQIQAIVQKHGPQDLEGALQEAYPINPKKVSDYQKSLADSSKTSVEIQNLKIDHDLKILGYTSRQLAGVTDQHSYDVARAGIKATTGQELPPDFNPDTVQAWQEKGMTYAEKLSQLREERTAKFQEIAANRQQQTADLAAQREDRMAATQQQQLGMEKQRLGLEGARVGLERQRLAQGPTSAGPSGGKSDVQETVAGMIDGSLPPVLPGRATKEYNAIMAESHRQKFDLAKAAQDWTATSKYLGTLNGAQQTRLRQATEQVAETVPLVRTLVTEWDSSGIPYLSAANLAAAKKGAYGNKAQSLANRLDAQIADMTSELGTVYKGGNSSTDESLRLAARNLQGEWSRKAALDALDQIEQNIKYRRNSMKLGPVSDSNNRYAPNLGGDDPLTVQAPNGKTYKFTSPEKAAAFKKAAGIQ